MFAGIFDKVRLIVMALRDWVPTLSPSPDVQAEDLTRLALGYYLKWAATEPAID